jgi:hypothetical protein
MEPSITAKFVFLLSGGVKLYHPESFGLVLKKQAESGDLARAGRKRSGWFANF